MIQRFLFLPRDFYLVAFFLVKSINKSNVSMVIVSPVLRPGGLYWKVRRCEPMGSLTARRPATSIAG